MIAINGMFGKDLLYRSDFFPGLGWMLTKDLWLEFQTKWPKASVLPMFYQTSADRYFFFSFWDDWIREPEQRKDRACIRPELSRSRTFGKIGVSK